MWFFSCNVIEMGKIPKWFPESVYPSSQNQHVITNGTGTDMGTLPDSGTVCMHVRVCACMCVCVCIHTLLEVCPQDMENIHAHMCISFHPQKGSYWQMLMCLLEIQIHPWYDI